MNLINLKKLEDENLEKLKSYYIDSSSIAHFKSNIKQVSAEEADRLGKDLVNLLSSKSYRDDQYDKVLSHIMNGANIEYKTPNKGIFPLLVCARKNYFQTGLLLIRAGANVNQTNNYLTTAVMACAKYGNLDMLKVLILLNADINMRYLDGESAIMSAKRHENRDVFTLLANQQAYLNIRCNLNHSINDIEVGTNNNFVLSNDMVIDTSITDSNKEKVVDENVLINQLEQRLDGLFSDNKELIKVKKRTTEN